MASNHPKDEEVGVEKMHDDDDDYKLLYQPVSPSSQCIHTSILSLCIIAVAESEIPFNLPKILATLRDDLLRVNSRFSSVVVTDHKGFQWWKKVDVDVEDHVVVPSFPSGLSQEAYTQHFKNYLSKISQDQLPEKQPLWEMHVLKYPTRENTEGTLIFKMHHALGDGFSIMGALFSCLKRADNPSLPLTFPSSSGSSSNSSSSKGDHDHDELMIKVGLKKMVKFVSGFWNSAAGFAWSVLQSTVLEDDQTVIRSGTPGVEFRPIDITSVAFSLDHMRQVKSKVGGTLNDVVVGLVFYGTHLYSQALGVDKTTPPTGTGSQRTALVLLNTRMVNGYRNLEDMVEKDMWGNHFSFIHLSLPSYSTDQEKVDPLSFILKAKKTIKRNRNSLSIYLNSVLLRLVGSIKGPEAISQYVHSTLRNTSMTISNLAGPVEKMVIADHPINNLYFTVSGSPQSLLFTIMSYMGKLTLVMTTEKGFIDSQLLASCMKEAFKKIFEEACGRDAVDGTKSSY